MLPYTKSALEPLPKLVSGPTTSTHTAPATAAPRPSTCFCRRRSHC